MAGIVSSWFDAQAANLPPELRAAVAQKTDPMTSTVGRTVAGMTPQFDPSQPLPGTFGPAISSVLPQGSLAALGGGTGRNAPIYNPVQPPQNSPQPVPGMPPQPFQPNPALVKALPDLMQGKMPDGWFNPGWGSEMNPGGNRGSGQPINQPLSPLLGGPIQDNGAALGQATDQGPYGQKTPQQIQQYLQQGGAMAPQYGQSMGSLQSLGMGNPGNPVGNPGNPGNPALSQSGMVNLRGPDGSTKAVAQNDLSHWLSKGAVRA